MVSKTFYILVLVSLVNVVIALTVMGFDNPGTAPSSFGSLPMWVPATLLIIVAGLDVIFGYLFENYEIKKKPKPKSSNKSRK